MGMYGPKDRTSGHFACVGHICWRHTEVPPNRATNPGNRTAHSKGYFRCRAQPQPIDQIRFLGHIHPKYIRHLNRCRNQRARQMKVAGILILAVFVAACSNTTRNRGTTDYSVVTRAASGPISRACLSSDRKARNRQLCGCIQAAADRTLSKSDQTLAASFYSDPQKAQDVRQSDRSRDEIFWQKYKNYSETAEAICQIR